MNELFSLKDKVAVVTGALGLLGREHCFALAEAGANVVVADLNKEQCKSFAEELSLQTSTQSIGLVGDIVKPSDVIELRNAILEKYGKIDILVNNAAVNDMYESPLLAAEKSKFESYPLDLWQQSLNVNVTGTFLCSQIIGSVMADRGKGCIINIASTYGVVAPDQSLYVQPDGSQPFFKSPAYPTTKGAVIAFTKFLATYWARKGVRVNALSPGGIKNGQDEFFVKNYSRRTPLGRMAQPSDYKGALIFLASDASGYMTGANVIVDGGWTAW